MAHSRELVKANQDQGTGRIASFYAIFYPKLLFYGILPSQVGPVRWIPDALGKYEMSLDQGGSTFSNPDRTAAHLSLSSSFSDKWLLERLDEASEAEIDALPFGVIGFGAEGRVEVYNAFEAAGAGLSKIRVLGRSMFDEIAPCMNNYLVAQRFEDEEVLDEVLPYVLTLRMRSTPVRLRLLKRQRGKLCYVLVERDPGTKVR